MTVSVCPAALVAAPVETVWALLMEPERYDEWWDAHIERVTPPGPATPGQVLTAWSRALGKKWDVSLVIEMVDAERHQLRFRSNFPLGIGGLNQLNCASVDASSCRVQFG
ncbi:MAG TPA: SRPBCC family protein [Ktedonobacterales bacterium]